MMPARLGVLTIVLEVTDATDQAFRVSPQLCANEGSEFTESVFHRGAPVA